MSTASATTVEVEDRHRHGPGGADAASKQPRKRVITAARRNQNRAAQHAYRQRQRELRQCTLPDARERIIRPLAPRPSPKLSLALSSGTLSEQPPLGLTKPKGAILEPFGTDQLSKPSQEYEPSLPTEAPQSFSLGQPSYAPDIGGSKAELTHHQGQNRDSTDEPQVSLDAGPPEGFGVVNPGLFIDQDGRNSGHGNLELGLSSSPSLPLSFGNETENPFLNGEINVHSTGILLPQEAPNLSHSDMRGIMARVNSRTDSLLRDLQPLGLRTAHHADEPSELLPALSQPLPDPLMNSIETAQTTTFLAVLTNAVCLGFDLERLQARCQTYMSPFFRPLTTTVAEQYSYSYPSYPHQDPRALVTSAFSTTASLALPIHLQPTMAQILIPHHASLDLIPLPFLRERAIMLSAAMPHLFDLWDLKLDIYIRGALICWRYDRDRDGGGGGGGGRGRGSGQPWDSRSWEAMPWFVKKWSMAMGG